jgi:preprotein translocase subunit SecA
MQFLNLDLPIEDWAKEEGIADAECASASARLADDDYAAGSRRTPKR